jgi:hypothetical protein
MLLSALSMALSLAIEKRLITTFFIMAGTSTPNRGNLPQYKLIHVQ